MRAGLQITRLSALRQPRTCDLQNARPTHCRCGYSGYDGTVPEHATTVACLTVIFSTVDLWHCCVCCTRSGVTRCTPFVALYLCLMCQSGLHAVLLSHISILMRLPAAEPRSTAGLLFPSQYLAGTLWLTPYSMVWDWRVSDQVQCLFVGLVALYFFCLQLFSLSLLFLYRLVAWGWGLRTDRVAVSLSPPCIANFF